MQYIMRLSLFILADFWVLCTKLFVRFNFSKNQEKQWYNIFGHISVTVSVLKVVSEKVANKKLGRTYLTAFTL
jgi:hypothetical protein